MRRVGAIIAIVLFAACSSGPSKSQRAYTACQHALADSLISPATAIYPKLGSTDVMVVFTHNDKWATVISHVDSQNALGATVRSNASCTMLTNDGGKTWTKKNAVAY